MDVSAKDPHSSVACRARYKYPVLVIAALVFLFASCAFLGITVPRQTTPVQSDAEPPFISVLLEPSEGVTITSQNPVIIRSGQDASFEAQIAEGFFFSPSDNLTYENGIITAREVLYPTTICDYCYSLSPFKVTLVSNVPGLGEQSYVCGPFEYGAGCRLSLTAQPAEKAVFLGFSLDRSFADGGEVLSYDGASDLTINGDITVVANYNPVSPGKNTGENVQRVVYHMEGGQAFGGHDTFYADYTDDYYYYPNALPDLGYFTREGCVLAGYTDRNGAFVGCGWNAVTDKTGTAELYAFWLPETDARDFDFVWDEATGGVKIASYHGAADTVAVPLSYRGKPVTVIGQNAFSGCSFRTLMISRNVVTVEDGAVRDCPSLTELIFSDGVMNISDGAVQNCPSFRTLKMNAVMMPRFCDDREGTYAIKYEHVRASADMKKFVIFSGSNCVYGIDSNILYDALNPEYGFDIVNYACNKYAPALFFLEACRPYLKDGDILLYCPEDSEFQFGLGRIVVYIWHYFESAYEAFAQVDMRHFDQVFSSFATYNAPRPEMPPRTYQMKTTQTTNRFGDYIAEKKGHVKSFDPFTVANKVNLQVKNVTKHLEGLNSVLDSYASEGVRIYLTHAVNNINSLRDESLPGGAVFKEFERTVAASVHATVISKLEDYVMEPEYFYNSNQHLNSEGARLRTRALLRDILAQIEKEGT